MYSKVRILYRFFVVVLVIQFCNGIGLAQENYNLSFFAKVKSSLNAPDSTYRILSVANCLGPQGKYQSITDSDGSNLNFQQIFSYRDESVDLFITGKKGRDKSGEALSDFMIFYGKMHDFVRIALQPEYLIHEVDSVKHSTDGIRVNGKTSGYPITYFLNSDRVPLYYTFFLPDQDPITTYFESWKTTPEDIKVPDIIKIVDGEKVFTYTYTEILITPY